MSISDIHGVEIAQPSRPSKGTGLACRIEQTESLHRGRSLKPEYGIGVGGVQARSRGCVVRCHYSPCIDQASSPLKQQSLRENVLTPGKIGILLNIGIAWRRPSCNAPQSRRQLRNAERVADAQPRAGKPPFMELSRLINKLSRVPKKSRFEFFA